MRRSNPRADEPDTPTERWNGHMAVEGVFTSGPCSKAALFASPLRLELAGPLGSFHFSPKQVRRFNRGRLFPWLWRGFRISHRVAVYPREIAFMPVGGRSAPIVATLRAYGFGRS